MKKLLLLLMVIFISQICSFAVEGTDKLLDKSIEEFSKKNYTQALLIIESVLELEPNNNSALMYKKTIEDIISSDKKELENEKLEEVEDIISDDSVEEKDSVSNQNAVKEKNNLFSLNSYIGKNDTDQLIIENRVKVILGIPIIEGKFISKVIDYDITKIDTENIPFDEIFNIDSYLFDFAIGARYIPFKGFNLNSFFDIKLGASSLSRDSDIIVPYVGFDTESYIFSIFNDNIIFNNIWVGASGYLYNYDGELTNNFKLEGKAGFKAGNLRLGGFYNYTLLDSLETNNTTYGIILGITI